MYMYDECVWDLRLRRVYVSYSCIVSLYKYTCERAERRGRGRRWRQRFRNSIIIIIGIIIIDKHQIRQWLFAVIVAVSSREGDAPKSYVLAKVNERCGLPNGSLSFLLGTIQQWRAIPPRCLRQWGSWIETRRAITDASFSPVNLEG